ncbi:hypothetical protein XOCgx_4109 [Xanthomonas oryzae pv. oryzicola]|nr:hypothetical protein XOCgx_4109 [Xanthomonas oryzae pv. oryzicola]
MPGAGPAFCTANGGTKRGCLRRANAQRRRQRVAKASTNCLPASPLESRGRGDSRGDVACPERDPRFVPPTAVRSVGAFDGRTPKEGGNAWREPRPTTYLQAPLSQGGAATAAGMWHARSGTRVLYRQRRYEAWVPSTGERPKKAAEPADKPGSVVDSHSSRRYVTAALKQPTRIQRGPRQWIPIWSCSRWGLPCRSVTGLAVRSYRTISPLPAPRKERRRYLSVALSVGLRRPGVTWHLALWSPDFPRHSCE